MQVVSLMQKIVSTRTKSKPTCRNARNYRPMIECRLGLATHGAIHLFLSIQTLALLLGLVGCWCSVRGGSQLQLLHTHPLSASLELKPDATHIVLPRGSVNRSRSYAQMGIFVVVVQRLCSMMSC